MRKFYFLITLLPLFLSTCEYKEKARINKVEHFYISCNNAKQLFKIFTKQIGLPVVWDYQKWGSFSSGGVSLGNVVVEFVESPKEQETTFFGIALEANQSLRKILPALDSLNISHGNISKAADWSTLSLNDLLPEYINLFLCDYHNWELVYKVRKDATEKLEAKDGGPLGIILLKEIIIRSEQSENYLNKLTKLPGIVKTGEIFHFPNGPDIKLMTSDSQFLSLLIKVKSLKNAHVELDSLGLNATCTDQGLVLDQNLFRFKIVLFE